MISKLVAWLIGKKIVTAEGSMTAASKAKIAAILGMILPMVEPISIQLGHPVHIPDMAYKILGFAGLWAVRDAIKSSPAVPASSENS